jgi:RimJ/RimL family protein N-acetyltransferase
MTNSISTERLCLLALTREQIELYRDAPERLEKQLEFPVSRDNVTEIVQQAMGMKLSKMASVDTDLHPWYTYWLIVVTAEEFGAGLAGFKGMPDPSGKVEISYGIDPAFRGQGYTTEAVRALIGWAFGAPACHAVLASVKKDNLASNHVLAKAGLSVYHETADTLHWRIERGCDRLSSKTMEKSSTRQESS